MIVNRMYVLYKIEESCVCRFLLQALAHKVSTYSLADLNLYPGRLAV